MAHRLYFINKSYLVFGPLEKNLESESSTKAPTKGIIVVNWCSMCKQNRDLWMLALSIWVQKVMLKRAVDLLACWKGRFARHCNGDI